MSTGELIEYISFTPNFAVWPIPRELQPESSHPDPSDGKRRFERKAWLPDARIPSREQAFAQCGCGELVKIYRSPNRRALIDIVELTEIVRPHTVVACNSGDYGCGEVVRLAGFLWTYGELKQAADAYFKRWGIREQLLEHAPEILAQVHLNTPYLPSRKELPNLPDSNLNNLVVSAEFFAKLPSRGSNEGSS